MIARFLLWLDDRVGTATFVHHGLRKAFPDHWSFMLGEINMYAFLVLLATGTYLALWFNPGSAHVVYNGPYDLMRGRSISEAYDSVMHLSFAVNAGLLIRQIHHWAADIFLAGIVVHACRIFFTGAFRKPRELNWIVGTLLLFAAMFEGFTGYSLPDDLMSGIGLRIGISILQAVPVVGSYLLFFLQGGSWPSAVLLQRFFITHVFVIPGLLLAGITVHLMMVWRQKHTQFPGPRRTEENVVGSPLFPLYALRSLSLQFAVIAVCCIMGAFVQINPVWLWGPYETWKAIAPAQPDWYVGWLDGALRLFPRWPLHLFGHFVPPVFWPGLVLPLAIMGFLMAYPFGEALLRRDRAAHHLLDLPRDAPLRTAFGVSFLTLMAVLLLAGSNDLQARYLHISFFDMLMAYRLLVFFGPAIAFFAAYRMTTELKTKGGVHEAGRVRVVRNAEGGYDEEPV
ncbi:MAG: cytochrome bc complex cytochrome b subunit [Candidatus Baltobacteraceae bacterium]